MAEKRKSIPERVTVETVVKRRFDLSDPEVYNCLAANGFDVRVETGFNQKFVTVTRDVCKKEELEADPYIAKFLADQGFTLTGILNSPVESSRPPSQYGGYRTIVHFFPGLYAAKGGLIVGTNTDLIPALQKQVDKSPRLAIANVTECPFPNQIIAPVFLLQNGDQKAMYLHRSRMVLINSGKGPDHLRAPQYSGQVFRVAATVEQIFGK